MYRSDLDGLLQTKTIANHFFLFGVDEYQIESYGSEILALYKSENTNVLVQYFDEYDFARAKSHLSEMSLFGDENLLHIKTDKKIPSKELKELVDICKRDNGAKFLLEIYDSDAKLVSETARVFGVNFARFFKPSNQNEAMTLLANHARKISLNITQSALYEIYFIHNENLYLCVADLNKLKNLDINIDQNIVKNLVSGLSSVPFETFFNKILSNKDIRDDFFDIICEASFNEIMFINALYSAFYRLFKLHAYIKIHGKFDIKQVLGYTPPTHIINQLKQQSLSISLNKFQDIFVTLNAADFDIKTKPSIDKSSYLISVLLRLQNIISRKN
ncbi:DNA polymerase III subunit delta [Campylobacter majalis]|uniref:DNA polymerase III subunit delta n=1 Tax=Campylobacter majalis TaxID=2790656 RepID=UPI003D68F5CF